MKKGDIKKGETVHTTYFKSRGTQMFIDDTDESPEVQISYEKMRINLNKTHPREFDKDGKPLKIPICKDIGALKDTRKDKKYIFDVLGVGMSVYFKLLKGLIRVMGVLCMLSIPLFYIYSCGNSDPQR